MRIAKIPALYAKSVVPPLLSQYCPYLIGVVTFTTAVSLACE
jgi:hypothetical protein